VSGHAVRVIALHGFLGGPADWDVMPPLMPWAEVRAVNLWHWFEESGAGDWDAAGLALDDYLREAAGGGAGRLTVLLAYSFGARLVLASGALASGRAPIAGTCLVSCNPGLPEGDTAARAARLEADEHWASLLADAPVDDLWRAWNAQPVLAGPHAAPGVGPGSGRPALPAARATLARAMRTFSVAGQPDFRPRLSRWGTPLLGVTGEGDAKFGALADGLARDGVRATFVRCPGAGHRVPWDNPEGFTALLASWIERL
jgi:2-succinyl-6-hydroxy-2,4-cyclohexadiene-1-carboxylate synthase